MESKKQMTINSITFVIKVTILLILVGVIISIMIGRTGIFTKSALKDTTQSEEVAEGEKTKKFKVSFNIDGDNEYFQETVTIDEYGNIGDASLWNYKITSDSTVSLGVGDSSWPINGYIGEINNDDGKLQENIPYYIRIEGTLYKVTHLGCLINNNDTLKNVEIPSSITSIGSAAFRGCTGLTEITIPESVTNIGSYAFEGCSSLAEITIPESVTSIGYCAFSECTSLVELIIPSSITSIGSAAFRECTSLTEITIPNSVTNIEWGAFYNCSNLTSVTIEEGVTSIDSYAFYGCTGLTNVYYTGTEEEWSNISISSYGNTYLTGAIITYNYTPEE